MQSTYSRRNALLTMAAAGMATLTRPALGASARHGILGQHAPLISGSHWIDPAGEPSSFEMSELDGKWVYLKCFQSWCPGCHKYGFPALKAVSDAFAGEERFRAIGLQTVFEGFGVNTVDKLAEIQRRYFLHIKMGHDAGDPGGDHTPATMRRYRTGGTPWVVIVSPTGQVVFNDYHVNASKVIEHIESQLAA